MRYTYTFNNKLDFSRLIAQVMNNNQTLFYNTASRNKMTT